MAVPQLSDYLSVVAQQHRDKPNYMATLALRLQPYVDLMNTLASMIGMFTPNAVGDQLDKVAPWVGISRALPAPIADVYFSWGQGPGWGEGTWLGPNDSPSGLLTLPDDSFQILLKLVIAQNNWDGTIPGAYAIWNAVMGTDYGILIQDGQDMTMLIVFTGQIDSIITKALIAGGYFELRPAGVRITEFAQTSIASTPAFGFGAESSSISGWGVGCWIEPLL